MKNYQNALAVVSKDDRMVFIKDYREMVHDLFKVGKELGNEFGGAMHAAVGISGEVGEFINSMDFKHMVEECGDVEFYLTALELMFPERDWSEPHPDTLGAENISLRGAMNIMQDMSAELLDVVKKGWVYNKAVDLDKLWIAQSHLRMAMVAFYRIVNIDRASVCWRNQQKLIGPNGRYPHGTYSDKQAQERADKQRIVLN